MKTYYKLLIFISCIIVAMGLFLYYFLSTSKGYSLDIRKELDVEGTKVVFKAKAEEIKMELAEEGIFEKDKEIAKKLDAEVFISIESDKKVECTYDLAYVHSGSYIRYTKTKSDKNEFTIAYDGNDEIQLPDFNQDAFLIGNFKIAGPTYEERKTAEVKFYNLEEDQQLHVNTIYGGSLKIDNIKCNLV